MRVFLALVAALVVASSLAAQPVEPVNAVSAAHVRATEALTPRGEAAPLPVQNFSVSRGIGIVEDDGNSYWPGVPSNFTGPATFRLTPAANNTFMVQHVAFQFDDPSTGSLLFNGAVRPILNFLDANYIRYNLPSPLSFAGKQYTTLSVSTWGAVAFGNADSTQVNYDPTVVSSMFRVPMVAVWYELFYYPSDARIITKAKPQSVVITWQNLLSRHTLTRCTFQVELFNNGEILLSYQSLPVDHGIVGMSTGTETATHQTASAISATDLPLAMQAASASLDDYGGVIAGVTLTLKATPAPTGTESFRYSLMINGVEAIGLQVSPNQAPYTVISTAKIPDFPAAQINSWEVKQTGETLSFRFPATSLEPYLSPVATNTWSIKSTRFGGAGFLDRTVTQTLPITMSIRHSLLPSQIGPAVEVPAEVFQYLPGVWDTDRIRESIAAYLVSRGQTNVDSFRFFPTVYDDGLRHSNYAGTYPRQKSVSGTGTIPARTECDCHYGAEFSALGESLNDEAITHVALTHELVHEYAFYADYRDIDGTVTGLWRGAGIPCFGGAHPDNGLANPSMFPDAETPVSTMSVMGGSLTGVFNLATPRFGMSRVEMYFMGLAAPAEVTPITFVQSGATKTITIDQVIAANGPRTPAYAAGQTRVFRVPTFVVKRKSEAVNDTQLQQLQTVLWKWQSRFWRETGGRARANLTLDGSCSSTLSATALKTVAASATGTVNVLTDSACAWTATTADAWISITSGAGGTGNGNVGYRLAANPGASSRTGTITIAGQPYTVTQAGVGRRRAGGR
ncbi:MAG: BACON domain-containing protein [Acidobacteriota bacterium]